MTKKKKARLFAGKTPADLVAGYAKATKKAPYLIRIEFEEALDSHMIAGYKHSGREFS